MAEPTRVLFLPASGEGVGGGHVLRCLALAEALAEQGADAMFACAPEGVRLVQRFGGPLRPFAFERDDQLAERLPELGVGAVVFDDYASVAGDEAALAGHGRLLVAIDDLANRPHAAALLIDPGYGRRSEDYAALLPPGAEVLAGPDYALLRRSFLEVPICEKWNDVRRLFVGFGLADPGGITARAVEALLPALPKVRFEVAVGASAPSLPALRRLARRSLRLHLHVESDEAAKIMSQCQMAVGAGGASTWERAVLGLPSLSVIVADNQRALAHALADEGAQLTLDAADPDFEQALPRRATALAADPQLRSKLWEKSRILCDGHGAKRASSAILQALERRRAEATAAASPPTA